MDSWYDLTIRELSDLSDPATEKLVEAAELLPEPAPEADDENEAGTGAPSTPPAQPS